MRKNKPNHHTRTRTYLLKLMRVNEWRCAYQERLGGAPFGELLSALIQLVLALCYVPLWCIAWVPLKVALLVEAMWVRLFLRGTYKRISNIGKQYVSTMQKLARAGAYDAQIESFTVKVRPNKGVTEWCAYFAEAPHIECVGKNRDRAIEMLHERYMVDSSVRAEVLRGWWCKGK